ncbi:MAG: alcohol dehydrogenase catalytic domain-containing protein [Acidimicrobiales bacterium]
MSVPAYSITTESIAAEAARVGDDPAEFDVSRVLTLDEIELPALGPLDVHVRILAVSAEHNIDHAATADTINIADARGGRIVPGNSATAEVLTVGPEVTRFAAGDIVITHCNGGPDRFGFPLRIWAYDAPESIGWYAKEAVVGEWQLIAAPLDCGLDLWEMAALPLRAPTAYHLWRRALGIYRVKVPYERQARLNVLGFGGGVSELFLQMAQAEGHRSFYCAGNADRRAVLEAAGIETIDQNEFNRFAEPADVKAFGRVCKDRTDGELMHLVCDMLRGPVYPAGLAVSARQGVNVSAGWQLSQVVEYNSTLMSVKQITIDHTHYETVQGCEAATDLYGRVFRPTVHHEIYGWADLPRAHQEMHLNTQTGIPIIRMTDDLPASVASLV